MRDESVEELKQRNVRECIEQIGLGRPDRDLQYMGFRDGCIREARQFINKDDGPYGYQNHPSGSGRG